MGRIRLSDLHADEAAWPREGLDRDRVTEFAGLFEEEGVDALPPIEVVADPETGGFLLADGWHRREALMALGIEETGADILAVNEGVTPARAAFERAIETAAKSSKPLNRREKQLTIARLLEADPTLSDRAVGRLVGVDHKTVGRVRERGISPPTERRAPVPVDQVKRLLRAFELAYEERGFGLADFFLGERTGERFAAIFEDVYGEEALAKATAMHEWLAAAVTSLCAQESSDDG